MHQPSFFLSDQFYSLRCLKKTQELPLLLLLPPPTLPQNTPYIDTVEFHTKCSLQTYDRFINEILTLVTTPERRHFGLHYLPAISGIPKNFFFIELIVQKNNLYIVAFKNDLRLFYFDDTNATVMKDLFTGRVFSDPVRIGIDARYPTLEGELQKVRLHDRTRYPLGFKLMDDAVQSLYDVGTSDRKRIARGFLLFLQMISECCRLEEFFQKVRRIAKPDKNGLYAEFNPSTYDASSQNNWGSISQRVFKQPEGTADNLAFVEGPVALKEDRGAIRNIGNVAQARPVIKTLNSR